MTKKKIRVNPYLYPFPVVIIGTLVNNKPNFMPLGWISLFEYEPVTIAISSSKNHYTNQGIKNNLTFSVNTPSVNMVLPTDYCGLFSGKESDKSEVFDIFYGELKTAPMITDAPLNLECKVVKILDTKDFVKTERGHDIFIGEVINAYTEEQYLTNTIPDIEKMKPFVLTLNDNNYWKVGEHIGRAWSIGKNYEKK
jgi:flavin reductase (DIM6/NTAB) family NADH-FMN oxidoreductase RutF